MTSRLWDECSGSNGLKPEAELNSRGFYLGRGGGKIPMYGSARLLGSSSVMKGVLAAAQELRSSANAPSPPQNLLLISHRGHM